MAEIVEPTIEELPRETISWSRVWISAITRPSTKTYEWILRDPQASATRAYRWIFISVFIGATLRDVISMFLSNINGSTDIGATFFPIGGNVLIATFSVLDIAFTTWVVQTIAGRAFGGSGNYAMLVYVFAACAAPMYLVNSLVSAIPIIECLAFPLFIYGMVLAVIGLKAVEQVSTVQAVVSYFFAILLIGGFTICILAFLGLSITTMFQNSFSGSGSVLP